MKTLDSYRVLRYSVAVSNRKVWILKLQEDKNHYCYEWYWVDTGIPCYVGEDKCDGLKITACELQHKHVISTYNRFKDREGVKITKEAYKTLFQHLFHFND